MNDSFTSVSVSFGKRFVTKNRIGRNARPHSLIVLNTVIAIATPSMLREEVPVAVASAAEVVVLTAAKAMRRPGCSQVLASAHSTEVQSPNVDAERCCASRKATPACTQTTRR